MGSFSALGMYHKLAQPPQGAISFVSLNLTRSYLYFLSRLLPVPQYGFDSLFSLKLKDAACIYGFYAANLSALYFLLSDKFLEKIKILIFAA